MDEGPLKASVEGEENSKKKAAASDSEKIVQMVVIPPLDSGESIQKIEATSEKSENPLSKATDNMSTSSKVSITEEYKDKKSRLSDHPTKRSPFYTSTMTEVLLAVSSCLKKRDEQITYLNRKLEEHKHMTKLKSEMHFSRA